MKADQLKITGNQSLAKMSFRKIEDDMDILIVVDMQNDFIDGALGTKEAVSIVPQVVQKIKAFDGMVFYTKDTHPEYYMETLEGQNLPVPHCIAGTKGWELNPEIKTCVTLAENVINKPTFGSRELGELLVEIDAQAPLHSITLVGLCTDICVISNALLLKAMLPQTPIYVDAACCAGVTPESHDNALNAMEVCQIKILNRE